MRALFLLSLALVAGCPTPEGRPETCNGADDDGDSSVDEGEPSTLGCPEDTVCADAECAVAARVSVASLDAVDLLFVVDNSNSMVGEQLLLVEEIPAMLTTLVSGDVDGDGVHDFQPVASLHVGVVTTDMGAGPMPPPGMDGVVPSCDPGLGDDGILRTVGSSVVGGCRTEYPAFVDFGVGGDPMLAAADVSCVVATGTGGCGFEQQLEAMLKAISPSRTTEWVRSDYEPPIFAGATAGQGDGSNDGFVRDGTVLALVILSDEEDCSVPDYSLFYRVPEFSSVGLNLRCFTFPEELYPIGRYVDGLLALRDTPGLLVYAPIVGVPPSTVGLPYDAILADPAMQEVPDPAMSPAIRLVASCSTADGGEAFPPRRFVELARDLERAGATVALGSICETDFARAIDGVVEAIGGALGGSCLPRPLPTDGEGLVPCRLVETLPVGTTCDGRLGRSSLGTARVGDVVVHRCEIIQEIGAELGWFYDDGPDAIAECGATTPPGQRLRVAFVDDGAELTLYCDPDGFAP